VIAPTGTLRASINLGNPVLAQGTSDDPSGVTVDIAREVAARLDLALELVCFDAARKSLESMTDGRSDLCFLAVDPARAAEVAFTAPYVVIEGVYAVASGSPIQSPEDVDRPGVRIGVKKGSAYDLYLTRTLEHAELVRGDEGTAVYEAEGLEVGAGIRQPVTAWVEAHPGQRVVEPRFMEIRQAVATPHREAVEELSALVAGLVDSGWVDAHR